MNNDIRTCNPDCPYEVALNIIGGKWKGFIIFHLWNSTRRFSELQRLIPNVTQRMLTKQLRELEGYKIIKRTVYSEVPPRVEYSLTETGTSIKPVLEAIEKWGIKYIQEQEKSM